MKNRYKNGLRLSKIWKLHNEVTSLRIAECDSVLKIRLYELFLLLKAL